MDTNATRRIKRGGAGPKPVGDTPAYAHEGRTFLFFLVCSLFVHAVFLGSFLLLQKPGKVHKTVELINISVTSLPGPAGGGESEEIKQPKEIKKEEIPEKEQVKVASKLVEKKPNETKKKPDTEAPKTAQTAPKGPGVGPVGGGKQTEDAFKDVVAVEGGVDSKILGGYLGKLVGRVSRDWSVPKINTKVLPRTVVFFSIDRYGKISNIRLETSSGNVSLDNSAISTIRAIKNVGSLPAGYKDETLGIHYTFIPENK
jgi:TonB family protein